VGVGGLGHLATQYASKLGSKVIALDVSDEQLSAVKDGGFAHEVVNTSGLSPAEVATAFAGIEAAMARVDAARAVHLTDTALGGRLRARLPRPPHAP
jgi:D-arabinose 1-dehydrogenase-like Zn-dependent alcohol dehydrogenase